MRRRRPAPRRPLQTRREVVARRRPHGANSAIRRRLRVYLQRHAQALVSSLARLLKAPLASLMTIMVIGIALALPTGFYLVIKNMRGVSTQWQSASQMSVFLQKELPPSQLERLLETLASDVDIARFEYQDPAAALAEFRQLAQLGDSLDALDDNPLPGMVIVQPRADDAEAIAALAERLQARPEVDLVQLDRRWLERLYAIVELGRRAVLVLASLLGLAVLLVVGNTIRLSIESRRAEIQITKLIGGTDGFIRRPFLYGGAWYGLFGGIFALVLVNIALLAMRGPVRLLASLYDDGFGLLAVDIGAASWLLLGAIVLGWAGSWLAVSRHLSAIQPS